MIFDDAKWNAFVANPDANVLQDDPAFAYASAFYDNYNSKYAPYYTSSLPQRTMNWGGYT